jgi:metal-sulfur cluster biosynthetic enzyme
VSGAVASPGRAAVARLREEDVLRALAGVLDPELDQSLVELGFVKRVRIEAEGHPADAPARARVHVELRLPTYWCAPNFSWMMVEDARAALLADPRVEDVEVALVDHHAADDISTGVGAGRAFGDVFDAAPDRRLGDLRDLFRRKALLARQERALRSLGLPDKDLARLRVGDLPDTDAVRAYLAARANLDLDCSSRAPALTDAAGRPVSAEGADAHLRRARLMRVSIEGNAAFCRGLLATRYGEGPA